MQTQEKGVILQKAKGNNMERRIYLDNISSTNISSEVLNEVLPCFTTFYGEASKSHVFGREASGLLNRAKDKIAKAINANTGEIYFTSGVVESNNWAILGLAHANKSKGNHIIVSKLEDESVLACCKKLESEGYKVDYINCDSDGLVSLVELLHYISEDTILVSVKAIDSSIGTIQNIKTLSSIAHDKGAIFHTDASNALGFIKVDVVDMGIDAMTISSHCVHGPKGVGALYVKSEVKIDKLLLGSSNEENVLIESLNVPLIVGMGKALDIANRDLVTNNQKLKGLRDYFIRNINDKIEYIKINGHPYQKVNNILSVSFEMVNSQSLMMALDCEGISVSASINDDMSKDRTLKAIGLDEQHILGTLRFSFDKSISKDDIDFVIETLAKQVARLRALSPITKTGRAK